MLFRNKPVQALLLLLLALLVACSDRTGQPDLTEFERLKARAAAVTIVRDDFGVPHIYGKTDADAVFGMLYAQSEDDFNRVEQNYIWATGRLAEVEGEDAIYSDLRARLYMTVDEAKATYESAPDWLKDLCDAFADGINYYLLTHPHIKPRLIERFEPWMPMYFSEGSIGGDIEQVPLEGIRSFYGGDDAENEQPLAATPVKFREPSGSNGGAISGAHTASGHAR
jgi:acyl-homoserine lactone acylase PvdQ